MIAKLVEGNLKTKYGEFQEILFYDGQKETIALVKGDVLNKEGILCRVHSSCIFGHYFNSIECDCQEEMNTAQSLIEKEGKGIIILMDQEGKGNGHMALLKSVEYKRRGVGQAEAYVKGGFRKDNRDFSAAAKILNSLGVNSIRLLTANPNKVEIFAQYEIKVETTVSLDNS